MCYRCRFPLQVKKKVEHRYEPMYSWEIYFDNKAEWKKASKIYWKLHSKPAARPHIDQKNPQDTDSPETLYNKFLYHEYRQKQNTYNAPWGAKEHE